MPYKKIVIEKESAWGTAVENTHWRTGSGEQILHLTKSGQVRLRERLKNLLVLLGEYLIKIGGG